MTVSEYIERKKGNQFQCPIWQFEAYCLCEGEHGEKYIIGCAAGKPVRRLTKVTEEEKSQNFFDDLQGEQTKGRQRMWIESQSHRGNYGDGVLEEKMYDDYGMLIEGIRLGEKLFQRDQVIALLDMGSYEQEYPGLVKDAQSMIAWCKKHGLPMESREAWENYHRIGVRLGDFRRFLAELYLSYLHFLKIYREDLAGKVLLKNMSQESCKAKLHDSLLKREIVLDTDFSHVRPRLFFRCESLADVIFAQLRFQCMDDLSGDILSICELCGQPYMKHRTNHRQCEDCQAHAPHRSMAKKREEKRNAKKAGQQ